MSHFGPSCPLHRPCRPPSQSQLYHNFIIKIRPSQQGGLLIRIARPADRLQLAPNIDALGPSGRLEEGGEGLAQGGVLSEEALHEWQVGGGRVEETGGVRGEEGGERVGVEGQDGGEEGSFFKLETVKVGRVEAGGGEGRG